MSRNRRDKKRRAAAPQAAPPRPATRTMLIVPSTADERLIAALPEMFAAGDVASMILWSETPDPKALASLAERLLRVAGDADVATLLRGDGQMVARLGFDGQHVDGPLADLVDAIERLKPERIVGAGGVKSRHDAMEAGEAGADYVFFGDPAPGTSTGNVPEQLIERAEWWQPLFEIPCVVFAPRLDLVGPLAIAGADFVALGADVLADPRGPVVAVAEARAAIEQAFRGLS
jgi:thiamine-phosphate pyrophosphorylase